MSRIVSACYIISKSLIASEMISIKSKAVSLALKLLQAALRWQALLDVPMRSWTALLLDMTVLQCSAGRWSQSRAQLWLQTKAHPKNKTRLQSQKMGIRHKNYFLRDTDAASGFAYSNIGINLPECFPLFPSNFAAVQIQFSQCIRN